jgi:MFS family permease
MPLHRLLPHHLLRGARGVVAALPDPFVLVPPEARRSVRSATRTVVGRTEPQRRLLAAVWATAAGDALVTIAAPLLVLERGGGVAAAALIVPLLWLPYIVLGIPSGIWADRASARRVLALSIVAELAGMAALAGAALAPELSLPLVYAGVLGVGVSRPISDAAVGASIGDAYDEPALGGTAVSAANGGGRLLGLAAGGITGAGGALPFALAAMAALTAVGLLFRIPGNPTAGAGRPSFRRSMRRAARALATPGIRGGYLLSVSWNFVCAGPTGGLIAPLLRSEAGFSGSSTAIVSALSGIAVFVASLVVARRMRIADILPYGQRGVALVGIAVGAIGLAGLGASGWAVAAVAIAGAFVVPFATQPSVALRLHAAPEELRATTVALGRAGVLGASFAGGVLWSLVAGAIGAGGALLLSGLATLTLYLADRLLFRPRLAELALEE